MKGPAQSTIYTEDSAAGEQKLKLLTYNIDGNLERDLQYRTECMLALILSEEGAFDVVHLQEVVQDTAELIICSMESGGYRSFHPQNLASLGRYFTLTFLRNTPGVVLSTFERRSFQGAALSSLGRDMLLLRVRVRGADWLVANCHLESLKDPPERIATRKAQLQEVLGELVLHTEGTGPAVLAGDLNIRAPEAKSVLNAINPKKLTQAQSKKQAQSQVQPQVSPVRMIDAADFIEPGFAGGRTWCPPLTEGQPAPQYMNIRFDRVYYTDSFCCSSSGTSTSSSGNSGSSSGGSSSGSGARQGRFRVRAVEYKLIGGEDIEWGPTDTEWRSYNTPSDHRGIVTVLRFETPHAYSDTGTVDTAGPFSGQHVTTVEDSDDEPEPPAHNAVAIGARAAGMGTVGAGLTGLGTAGTAAHIGGMVGGSTNTGPFSSSPYSSPPPSKRPRQNEAGSGAGAGDMRKLMRAAAEKRLG